MKNFGKVFKRVAKYVGLVVLLLLLIMTWLFATETGTRVLFTQILPYIGVKAENIEGSLLKGIAFDDLHIQTSQVEVHVYDSRLNVLWGQLFQAKAHIHNIHIGHLQIALSDASSTADATEGEVQLPLLPLDVEVDQFELNQFTLIKPNQERFPLDFSLKGKLVNGALLTQNDIRAYMFQQRGEDISSAGDAKIQTASEDDEETFSAGDAKILTLDVHLKELSLDSILPKSRVGGDFRLLANGPHLTQWHTLNMSIKTDSKSLWNAKPLQANGALFFDLKEVFVVNQKHVDIYLEKLKIAPSDVSIIAGENTVQLKGQLGTLQQLMQSQQAGEHQQLMQSQQVGEPQQTLILKAHLPQLSTLYPAIGESATFDVQINGSIEQHDIVLKTRYAPQVNDTQDTHLSSDSSLGKDKALKSEAYRYQLGQAPVQAQVHLQGLAHHLLQDLHWQAQIEQLRLQHAGYDLSHSEPFVVEMLKKGQWSLGQVLFYLKQPGGNVTQIKHQGSSQQNGRLLSQGEIIGLLIEKSFYHFLWDLENTPKLTFNLRMQREQQEDIGVQKNPFANIKNLVLSVTPQQILLNGDGEQTSLQGDVSLNLNKFLPIERGQWDIQLSDKSALQGHVAIKQDEQQNSFDINLHTRQLDLAKLSLGVLPSSLLNVDVESQVYLTKEKKLNQAFVKAQFLEHSQWNHKDLHGSLHWSIVPVGTPESLADSLGAHEESPLAKYRLEQLNTQLKIGQNMIQTQGAWGRHDDVLMLDVILPALAELYPGLSGGVKIKGEVQGDINQHSLSLTSGLALTGPLWEKNPQFMQAGLSLQGAWHKQTGWQGQLEHIQTQFQAYKLEQDKSAIPLQINPFEDNQLAWEVGPAVLNATVPGKQTVKIQLLGAKGEKGKWQTKGAIHHFVVNKAILDEVKKIQGAIEEQKGGVVLRDDKQKPIPDLVLNLDWNLEFDKTLKGTASIVRESGDIEVPIQKKFNLGLKQLALKLNFEPKTDETSVLNANFLMDTENKGQAKVNSNLLFKGVRPVLEQELRVDAVGHMQDIAWLSMFTDDLLSLGGAVDFDMNILASSQGKWHLSGYLKGDDLKIVEVENGVRLLNGSLRVSFKDTKAFIERLYFPAVIRVTPTEWRTRQWIEENPPAQQGSLLITGDWDLSKAKGTIKTVLDHYPVVQRSDRFAMMSGEVLLDAKMPKIALSGKVTADAGWASIDIKDTVPSVDGDVIVLKPGQTVLNAPAGAGSDNLSMNLTVDLGPRFYLVGMGLNSGLVGHITLLQEQGRLTAEGQFRTRGGAIEAYGQRLQIARGEIAFSGNITNPSLNIEALRRGLEVEAGLRVIGTAKRPKITLVSYPEVSEVEKLSWLIMGRGPDSSGADLALLFSVGGSLIGGDEPFYRKVGLDEIGVRAGSVGDSDNILPERTVADSTAYRGYEETNQLFYATKKFGEDWRVSAEQALSGSGTVLRGSYRLMKYLTVDLKVGTINGIELLYKRFFKE